MSRWSTTTSVGVAALTMNDPMNCVDFFLRKTLVPQKSERKCVRLQSVRLIPPRPVLVRLAELGAIGFVKGIHAELDGIEKKNPMYAPFCTELRSLVERFRLPEYTNRLKEWMYDDVDHV